MTFKFPEIQKEWLLNANINYSKEEIVDAFNIVERILGNKWIPTFFFGQRGSSVAIPIIDLGLTLKLLEGIPNFSNIINKMKKPETFLETLAEAKIIEYFKKYNFELEIEPELQVANSKKYPDLKILCDNLWVYTEVTRPDYSDHQKELQKTMFKLTNSIKPVEVDKRIEIYFYKEPNESEIVDITKICRDSLTKNAEFQEYNINGLAKIFINPFDQQRLHNFKGRIEEKRPVLFAITLKSATKNGVQRRLIFSVGIPFTDERADNILGKKRKQLSKDELGLIVIDITNIPGGLKGWTEIIKRRLQPQLNRRIGAVLLVQRYISKGSMKTNKIIIEHPNPWHTLPNKFLEVLKLI